MATYQIDYTDDGDMPDESLTEIVFGESEPADRALLPANGEAVANPGQNMTAEQLVEAIAEGLTGDYSAESVAVLAMEKLQKERNALQAELAAALARAQAAEEKVIDESEKMAIEYGDGYAAGMVDGVHDLHEAITKAIAEAGVGQRLPAVERVLAEYELMYLKSAETK